MVALDGEFARIQSSRTRFRTESVVSAGGRNHPVAADGQHGLILTDIYIDETIATSVIHSIVGGRSSRRRYLATWRRATR